MKPDPGAGSPNPTLRRRVSFATLGCKLNQFETDSLATQFRRAGYEIVQFGHPAEVTIINSCTVTNRADRKSRNLLYRALRSSAAARGSGPASGTAGERAAGDGAGAPLVVLTGCYVDGHRDELESDGTTYFVANDRKQSIPALVEGHLRGEVIHPAGTVFDFPVPDRIFHTRSVIKVQDGCDNFCTFCIIPHVRGRAVSRPWNEVVASVREAVAGGAREVVLTGVNMSRYRDGDVDFTELVRRCLGIDAAPDDAGRDLPDYRLRISSLEPDQLTKEFIDLFAHPRMAPHLHLCLQSASERMLLAMRRQYTYAGYERIVRRLRERDPLFNVTTDIIVGFPGETVEDLEVTLKAISRLGFGHVHCFPYSVRRGTRAERMPGHLAAAQKTSRAARVREAAAEMRRAYRQSLVGSEELVLVERARLDAHELVLYGLGEHYVPVEVRVPAADARRVTGPGDGPDSGHENDPDPARMENTFIHTRIVGISDDEEPVLSGVPR